MGNWKGLRRIIRTRDGQLERLAVDNQDPGWATGPGWRRIIRTRDGQLERIITIMSRLRALTPVISSSCESNYH